MKKLVNFLVLLLFFQNTYPINVALAAKLAAAAQAAKPVIQASAPVARHLTTVTQSLPGIAVVASSVAVTAAVAVPLAVATTTISTTPPIRILPPLDPKLPIEAKEEDKCPVTILIDPALKKKQYKDFSLLCAFVQTGQNRQLATLSSHFDLPGEKIPLSSIPAVEGTITRVDNHILVSNVPLPGVGPASFEVKVGSTPIIMAPHTGQQAPLMYPPFPKGKMVRLTNVDVPNFGNCDLVLYMPQSLLTFAAAQRAAAMARRKLGVVAGGGAALLMQSKGGDNVDAVYRNSSDTFASNVSDDGAIFGPKSDGGKNFSLGAAIGAALGTALGGSAGVSIGAGGIGITITGGIVSTAFVPIALGVGVGFGAVQVIRLGRVAKAGIMHWAALRRARKAAEAAEAAVREAVNAITNAVSSAVNDKQTTVKKNVMSKVKPAQQTTACGDMTPINNQPATGFGDTTPQKVETTGCGDTTPQQPQQPTGYGNVEPPKKPDIPECGKRPEDLPDTNILARLTEQEVKQLWGEILKGFGFDSFEQERLDHLVTGHLKGGKRVNADPNNPRTVFMGESELMPIAMETIEKGRQVDGDEFAIEYDFQRKIGETPDGKPLTKVRLIRHKNPQTGKYRFVTMYPVE